MTGTAQGTAQGTLDGHPPGTAKGTPWVYGGKGTVTGTTGEPQKPSNSGKRCVQHSAFEGAFGGACVPQWVPFVLYVNSL